MFYEGALLDVEIFKYLVFLLELLDDFVAAELIRIRGPLSEIGAKMPVCYYSYCCEMYARECWSLK